MYKDKLKLHKREKEHNKGQLRSISLDVTPRCNMNCPHCYASTFRKTDLVDLKFLKKALDDAYDLGVFHYILQGGEPITDLERLKKIIEMCYPDESFINVISNGWEMSKEKILFLKKIKVDKITFSLDSGIEKEHDLNRKKGSFKKTLQAIDVVLEAGLITSISIVVTHQSLHSDSFNKAIEIAKAKNIRIDVQIAEPEGKWDGQLDLLITPKDAEYLKKLRQDNLLSNGQSMIKRDIYCKEEDFCPAGTDFMAIISTGDVLPCNFLQFTLGNIKNKSLKKMREDLLRCKWFSNDYPHCLCGENRDFINSYIVKNINKPKPLNAYEEFNLLREKCYV